MLDNNKTLGLKFDESDHKFVSDFMVEFNPLTTKLSDLTMFKT